jgi:hypothetical protein
MASEISPTVACASTARTIGGTRLSRPRAAASTASSAARHAGVARGARPRARARSAALDRRIDLQRRRSVGRVGRRRRTVHADDDGSPESMRCCAA